MSYHHQTTGPVQQQQPVVEPGTRVEQRTGHAAQGLRVFQLLAAACGGVLFVFSLIAVFRVDFGAGFFDTTGAVASFGFSPAAAIAGILLGGAILAATLADQDRGSAAFIGLFTLLVGIAGLIVEGQMTDEVQVDRRSALLFVVLGAAVFVLALIPWFAGRRRVTTYDY